MHTGAEAYSTRARFWPPAAAVVAGASFSAPLPGPVRARRHHTDDVQTTRQQAAYSQGKRLAPWSTAAAGTFSTSLSAACAVSPCMCARCTRRQEGSRRKTMSCLWARREGTFVQVVLAPRPQVPRFRSRTARALRPGLPSHATAGRGGKTKGGSHCCFCFACLGPEGCSTGSSADQRGRRGTGGGTRTCPEAWET